MFLFCVFDFFHVDERKYGNKFCEDGTLAFYQEGSCFILLAALL